MTITSESPEGTPPAWLTIAEVADRLRVTRRFVETLIADELLPVARFGRSVRIRPSDVVALEEAARRAPVGGRRGGGTS